MSGKSHGIKTGFISLLKQTDVFIPRIQRDYAQGRVDVIGSKDIALIREVLLISLREAIENETPITLDYIYGSMDSANRFQPIDGQQRLTTLFLLHWYFAVKEGRLNEISEQLRKFSYETRQSATDFCLALAENTVCFSDDNAISSIIKECAWFHRSWVHDPTIAAMLNMLNTMQSVFARVENGFDIITANEDEPLINFWVLTLEDFGLSDDLFTKMNARGKKLNAFEKFKSAFEENLENNNITETLQEQWLCDIDNDWLSYFWKKYPGNNKEGAEIYLYRFIVMVAEIIYLKKEKNRRMPKDSFTPDDYRFLIKECFQDDSDIRYICQSFEFLLRTDGDVNINDVTHIIENHILNDDQTYISKAFVFACIEFCMVVGYGQKFLFDEYVELLKKLIRGQRVFRPDDKKYDSTLDSYTIGAFMSGISDLLTIIKEKDGDLIAALCADEAQNIQGISYMKNEIDKAILKRDNPSLCAEIARFENHPCFRGLIHNVVDNENKGLVISFDNFLDMYAYDVLLLKAHMSIFFLLEDKIKGTWNKVMYAKVPDNTDFYYTRGIYKKYVGMSVQKSEDENGDILLTRDTASSQNKRIADAVQALCRCYTVLKNENDTLDAREILQMIVTKNQGNPSEEKYYFLTYKTFITKHYNVFLRYDQYTIRKVTGLKYWDGHYNPYQKAVTDIANHFDDCSVKAYYSSTSSNFVEELDPIRLSNGIKLWINAYGKWIIHIPEGVEISDAAQALLKDDNELIETDSDVIQTAVHFIKTLGATSQDLIGVSLMQKR